MIALKQMSFGCMGGGGGGIRIIGEPGKSWRQTGSSHDMGEPGPKDGAETEQKDTTIGNRLRDPRD
jgi:hypothetical protein